MIHSARLIDRVAIHLVSLRKLLPASLQPKVLLFNHSERNTIITAVRALHGQGYPQYTSEMPLPRGVHPPMPGFTHADLLETVSVAIQAVVMHRGVSKEVMDALITHISTLIRIDLEAQGAEYQLANFFMREYKYRVSKTNTLYVLADEYQETTAQIVKEFVDSDTDPAASLTPAVRAHLVEATSSAMRNHLLQLLHK